MLLDLLYTVLGITIGVAFGPLAWRLGYRCWGEMTDSPVSKPWRW
jgi:hypothetical protein